MRRLLAEWGEYSEFVVALETNFIVHSIYTWHGIYYILDKIIDSVRKKNYILFFWWNLALLRRMFGWLLWSQSREYKYCPQTLLQSSFRLLCRVYVVQPANVLANYGRTREAKTFLQGSHTSSPVSFCSGEQQPPPAPASRLWVCNNYLYLCTFIKIR